MFNDRDDVLSDAAQAYRLNSREAEEVRRRTEPTTGQRVSDAALAGAAGIGTGLLTHNLVDPALPRYARIGLGAGLGLGAGALVHSALTGGRTREALSPALRDVQPLSGHLDTGNTMNTVSAIQELRPEVDGRMVAAPVAVPPTAALPAKTAAWAGAYLKIAAVRSPAPAPIPPQPGLIRRGIRRVGLAGAAGIGTLGALGAGAGYVAGNAIDPKAAAPGAAVGGATAAGAGVYGLGHLAANGVQNLASLAG